MFILPEFKRYVAGVDDAVLTAGITAAGSALAGGASAVAQSSLNKKTREFNREEAEKQRAWNEAMAEKQNAWNYEMWLKTNEYNDPSHQVQRLRDAGLNPLYYGLDGSSAQGVTAAQPLGYERASMSNQPNAVSAGIESALAVRSLQKDVELKNAQIDDLRAGAEGKQLDNQWKDMTLDARVEAEDLANSISKENIREIQSRLDINKQELKKRIAETDNEVEKRGLIMAEKMLAEANAKEVAYLMPYKKLLIQAQTDAQKESAAASYAKAAIDKGLLDSGYVDAQIESIFSGIRHNARSNEALEAQTAINEWKQSIRNGTVFNPDSYPPGVQRIISKVMSGFVGAVSTASEAVGGGLSGFFK